jgi:sulfide:quinone oxidoreductase
MEDHVQLGRRRLLKAAGATTALLLPQERVAAAPVATKARILIVGGGAAGISMAARLSRLLSGARITVLEPSRRHIYQPGLTLVAAGVWRESQVIEQSGRWMPAGVGWLQEAAAEIDPVAKVVTTHAGGRIPYDFLLVSPGLELAFDAVEGFHPGLIGREGIGCVYAGPEAAAATDRLMQEFIARGGDAVMTLPHTPLKCAGAPLKMTFILDDRLRSAGARGKARVNFHSPSAAVFGVPSVNERVLDLWRGREIGVSFQHRLKALEPARREAVFATLDGDVRISYDFLHLVPPMRAPAVVRESPLAVREGALAAGGWLDVDKDTLRHRRFPEVFGCGDVNGTPRGKTAATVKKSGQVVAANLVAAVQGREPAARFDGYTSCPLVTAIGRAMLIEFDYEGRLTPTLPGVDPLAESWLAWALEERALKPAYLAMLKGWT